MKTTQLEQDAEKALLTCLKEVPFVEIENIKRELLQDVRRLDFVVKVKLPDNELLLAVEVKNNGQPRVAREAINQLLRYRESLPYDYAVFVAPYISQRAAEICSKEKVGYVDLAGNCRLSFGNVYIQKEGKLNPFAVKRDLRSLYSLKAERVLRVLLANPTRKWRMEALAEEADVSLGQVANVKKLLADREWTRTERDGFWLSEPGSLLAEWAISYKYRRNQIHDFYSLKSVGDIESDLAEACRREGIKYALTGFSGAARMAPAVRYQRAIAYVQDGIERIASLLNLKKVSSGANVSLLEPYDDSVFYGAREFDRVRVASAIQLYLDLKGFRGRGEEAANALLEEVIRPQW